MEAVSPSKAVFGSGTSTRATISLPVAFRGVEAVTTAA